MGHIDVMIWDQNIELRQFQASDRKTVARLLTGLDFTYPNSRSWFDRRFDDVLLGKAQGLIANISHSVVGVAIITPKGDRRSKLSTIKVHPGFRRRGIASVMLGSVKSDWLQKGVEKAWVTVDLFDDRTARYLINRAGFEDFVVCRDLYGAGRHERILTWSPEFNERCPCNNSNELETKICPADIRWPEAVRIQKAESIV